MFSPWRAIAFAPRHARFVRILTLATALEFVGGGPRAGAQLVDQSETDAAVYQNVRSYVDLTPAELTAKIADLKGLVPVANNEEGEKALPAILGKVGENIQHFFDKAPDIASREEITMESRWPHSNVVFKRRQTFQYLLISHTGAGASTLREYRTDMMGKPVEPTGLQDGMSVTRGFASMEILFHPAIRSDAFFRYLGRQKVAGEETDVVVFAQRPGWAQAAIRTNVAGRAVLNLVQGVAWIDPTSCQIIRMRTDLLAPRPDVGLAEETTDITFGEVRFPEMAGLVFWLPKEVKVTTEWDVTTKVVRRQEVPSTDLPRPPQVIVAQDSTGEGDTGAMTSADHRIYRNTHQYSDYKLFSSQSKLVF